MSENRDSSPELAAEGALGEGKNSFFKRGNLAHVLICVHLERRVFLHSRPVVRSDVALEIK